MMFSRPSSNCKVRNNILNWTLQWLPEKKYTYIDFKRSQFFTIAVADTDTYLFLSVL